MIKLEYIDAGLMEYGAALELQRTIFERVAVGECCGKVIFVEHNHVYTLGKSGRASNLLVNEAFLASIGATYVQTDRGGDITYHGPGQLVIYPILNLDILKLSLREYIYKLEGAIIGTLSKFGIIAGRVDGATGVWVGGVKKIAAIGVRASRGVTMHGAAVNVTTDLSYFSHINACGFVDRGVTSMANEGVGVSIGEVKAVFEREFMGSICDCGFELA